MVSRENEIMTVPRTSFSKFRLPMLILPLILLCLYGCLNGEMPEATSNQAYSPEFSPASPKAPTSDYLRSTNLEGLSDSPNPAGGVQFEYSVPVASPSDGLGAAAGQNLPSRKIIQNHNIEVAIEDLESAEKLLLELVKASGGYISRSEVGSIPGARRQGSWTLRVPGNKASDIAAKILALGEPIRQSSDAKDVSEEFYDLEARIKNKKIEEERLIQHLKDSTGKLIDILAVEKELTRVRGEIEQAQGRLNMLANLTSLATIQVSLVEHKNYKPEPAPTFWTKAARTFHQSLEGLFESFAKFTLWVISWAPWLVFWGILIGFGRVIWIVRKAIKKD